MAESDPLQPLVCDEFEHTLDSSWRITLPKDWRNLKVPEFFVTESSASSGRAALRVLTRAEWQSKIASIESDPRRREDMKALSHLIERFASRSKRVEPDKDGRIKLPETLCKQIGITPDNPEVTLRGANSSFRIWNRKKLKEYDAAVAALEAIEGSKPTLQDHLGL
jgi:DNA-binding transcriptional regulator/RsmH inhibitor MraZ